MRKGCTCLLRVNRRAVQDLLFLVRSMPGLYRLHSMSSPILGGAIKRPLQDVVVAESQLAELECEVANPSAEGLWLKDGQHVFFSDNIRSQDVGELRLEGTHQLMLYIYSLAVYIFAVLETQDAVFGLELSHEDMKGSLWTKNGVEIQPSDKFDMRIDGAVHTLVIKSCTTQDEAVYGLKLGNFMAMARIDAPSRMS
uniref:Immunoglobulin I-set domain-containing protein n=1 Tax=Paramormyrops kingsleyae TaxID=1676925 RepID=A0A3B3QFH9_9TELE